MVYKELQPSLLSHSRRLRLSALRLLSSHVLDGEAAQLETVKRSLSGEEVSLDVQGVRERVLRISRMNQVLQDGDEIGANIAGRWLIGRY